MFEGTKGISKVYLNSVHVGRGVEERDWLVKRRRGRPSNYNPLIVKNQRPREGLRELRESLLRLQCAIKTLRRNS